MQFTFISGSKYLIQKKNGGSYSSVEIPRMFSNEIRICCKSVTILGMAQLHPDRNHSNCVKFDFAILKYVTG